MPAPIVAWAAKRAAQETARRFPGGPLAALVALAVGFAFLITTSLMSIVSVLGSGVGGAAAAAVAAQCDSGTSTASASALAASDIPTVVLDAYRQAATATGVDWAIIAGIGKVESDHTRIFGGTLNDAGTVSPPIVGIPIGVDTDNGRLDNDTSRDHAVGPMQFIPSTWRDQARDGNFDGTRDPQNIYDAALATGYYLKSSGAPADTRRAIFAYNHSTDYVNLVLDWARKYRGSTVESTQGGIYVAGGNASGGTGSGVVKIAQANLFAGLGNGPALRDDVRTVAATGADFITYNEMPSRTAEMYTPPGYSSYRTAEPRAAAETPVAWRTDRWDVLDRGTVLMHESPLKYATRYVNWVTLESKANPGTVISVVSAHALPFPEGDARVRLMGIFTTKLAALVNQLSGAGAVLVGGDFNVDYNADARNQRPEFPYHAMRAVNTASTWELLGPTERSGWATGDKQGGTIDYVFVQRDNGLAAVRHNTIELRSDHDLLWAEFRLTEPGASTGTPPVNEPGTITVGDFAGTNTWALPMVKGTYSITATFGQQGTYWANGHTGLDFAAADGAKVFASFGGKVRVENSSWAGPNYVIIDHGIINGRRVETSYGHMGSLNPQIRTGVTVSAGTWIGIQGALGNVSGPHLHFEVHVDGVKVNPMEWLNTAGSPDPTVGGISAGCPNTYVAAPAGVGAWGGHSNGNIPTGELCPLSFSPALLRCDAAESLNELEQAFRARFRHSFTPVGGYRTYAEQVVCYNDPDKITPSGQHLCAEPGTSNHGWAVAVDLAGGVENGSSAEHRWMLANAANYGWVLPQWARPGGSKPEPWHWEYGATPGGTTSSDPA